jgi:iron complex transport system substrate-binding protein
MSVPVRARVALITVLAVVLAACSGGTAGTTGPEPTGPPPAASVSLAPSAEPSAAAVFPVTLTDDEGTAVEIAAVPGRIVSLTPANTEILFAIGAGDRVVATDESSDYPAEAVALPDVATFAAVDIEQIVALDPDLVLAGGLGFTPAESIATLRELGIPVLVDYAASVEGVYRDITLIGDAVGNAAEAAAVVEGQRLEIQAIADAVDAAAVAAGSRPRVYYEVGYTDTTGQIFAPAEASFVAQMVELAGADPITTGDPNSYEIPLEALIEQDPQVIVLGTNPFYMPTAEAVAARPGWDVMTAVREGDIRPVQDTEITRPGPRLAIGLRNLATAIWPDVQLPPAT